MSGSSDGKKSKTGKPAKSGKSARAGKTAKAAKASNPVKTTQTKTSGRPASPKSAAPKPTSPKAGSPKSVVPESAQTGTQSQLEVELLKALRGDEGQRLAILRGDHGDPFLYLGPHEATVGDETGTVIRVHQPDAHEAEVLLGDAGRAVEMRPMGGGLFGVFLPKTEVDAPYRLRLRFPSGKSWERDDPYRFPTTLSDLDLYLLAEGTHLELWKCLGAHRRTVLDVDGWSFAVWAPNARRVSVVGPFCAWRGLAFPMRRLGSGGVWQIFLPDTGARRPRR